MLDSLCLTDLVHRETTITDNRWFVPGDVCSIHADRIAFFGFRLKNYGIRQKYRNAISTVGSDFRLDKRRGEQHGGR